MSHITKSILADTTTDLKKVIVDESSSAITYVGKSLDNDATTSQPLWQIQRLLTIGTETTREFAGTGAFDQVWDDRATLFPAAALTNVYSLEFDGINDYVNLGNTHLYDVGTQFSMSFWVWVDNVAAQRTIYSKVTNDGNVYGLSIQIDTAGNLWLQVRAAGQLSLHVGTAVVSTQAWHHIMLTYNGGNNQNGFRFYIDSVVDSIPASATKTVSILSGQNAMLGSRAGSANFFSGNIDEVTMWSIQFSQAAVTELYNGGLPTDPTTHSNAAFLDSWYRMGDNDAYPTILDNAGTADGTMTNMTAGDIVAEVP